MKLKTLLVIKAIVCLVFGALFVLVPGPLMSIYGVTLGAGGMLVARLYGASLLGNLVLTWCVRNEAESEALRAILLALVVYDAVGFVVALVAQFSGVMNALGGLIVALYGVLTLGFGYFRLMEPSDS